MKETVGHLPKNKQGELGRIVSVIRGQCNDVEMIILFGSYARGNYKVGGWWLAVHRSGGEKISSPPCYEPRTVNHELYTAGGGVTMNTFFRQDLSRENISYPFMYE